MYQLSAVLLAIPLALPPVPGRGAAPVPSATRGTVESRAVAPADTTIRCALGDRPCSDQAKKDGRPVVITDAQGRIITDEQGHPVTDQDEAARRAQRPGEGVWRNYDFVPGRRVLKVVSMDSQPVGRFPASALKYVSGNVQVVELDTKRWLEATSNSVVQVELPEETGASYSIEFLLRFPAAHIGTYLYVTPLEGAVARYPHDYVYVFSRPGVYRGGREVSATYLPGNVGKVVPVKLQVDTGYAILYVGSERAAQVPTARFPSSRTLEFRLSGNARFPTYVSDIVVAVGLDDLYSALVNDGVATTRGIFFDTASDRLRPESTRILGALVDALTRADTLRVTIEGHTDAQGEEGYNRDLSHRRATAVVAYLVDHGIAGSRLRAEGKGESEPVASNGTPEGRQENRRVVIRVTP